ncbi:MAG: hypothetical protein KQH53_07430 [Desulfarculaceae bacterium]|nr:hypothetical protein [Desulfarculaceae bacterium]
MTIPRVLLALLLVLTLASAAGAIQSGILTCPPAEKLEKVQGWWSAPGGWKQRRDYKPPTANASIDMFTGASYEGFLKGPGRMMCLYAVNDQPEVEYTLLVRPSKGGPMDYNWDCPPADKKITCTCNGFKRSDCEVRD